MPLLEFGRERQEIDVPGLVLTHHTLADTGERTLAQGEEGEKLQPISDAGSGSVQEKQKALLAEIVAKLNDLFQGDVTDDEQFIYVNNVIKAETLAQQAANSAKEQFSNSPDLSKAILDAIIDAFDAHSAMSKQALDCESPGRAQGCPAGAWAAL